MPILGSTTDKDRIQFVLERHHPDTIYHAAAYKHVHLVEKNSSEGVRNNVFGTLTLAQLAIKFDVKKFVLISTDKAVRPTNVMGASKRISEMILQALSIKKHNTAFAMVRFGNVLGSSGSVVPLFREQIKAGEPITLTHVDVTRYFMTISEAASLVIQAGAMTKRSDKSREAFVYLLDMGSPIKIYDLARKMTELSGLTICDQDNPTGDVKIEVIGLKPGEKLYEELLIGDVASDTKHPKIKVASDPFLLWDELRQQLHLLDTFCNKGDDVMLKKCLQDKPLHVLYPTE